MSTAMDRFFCLSAAEQQRLRDLQDDPESPFYRKVMSEIMRATESEDSRAADSKAVT